jgi:archaellum biogenesis protein FlaJ (TadC family)
LYVDLENRKEKPIIIENREYSIAEFIRSLSKGDIEHGKVVIRVADDVSLGVLRTVMSEIERIPNIKAYYYAKVNEGGGNSRYARLHVIVEHVEPLAPETPNEK